MCYIKLGNLLAQNISKGTDNIFQLLKEETEKAFEDRKALAKNWERKQEPNYFCR